MGGKGDDDRRRGMKVGGGGGFVGFVGFENTKKKKA